MRLVLALLVTLIKATWDAKEAVLAHLKPVVAHFWPSESPKKPCKWALWRPKVGQKWVKTHASCQGPSCNALTSDCNRF